jgi:plasmid stabilization system protein ParE
MYKVEYTSSAYHDTLDILAWLIDITHDENHCVRRIETLIQAIDSLSDFPYAYPIHRTLKPLKNEFRRFLFDKFIVFYWVDESMKVIHIARIMFARRSNLPLQQ